MSKLHVNLDALIQREDFEIKGNPALEPSLRGNWTARDLERESLAYQFLRKPVFQRETANWDPEKIADLIQSFVGGDLIPSVMLWPVCF